MKKLLIVLPGMLLIMLILAGCCQVAAVEKAPAPPAPAPMKPAPPPPKPAPQSACGPSSVSMAYPCGQCGGVNIEKTMPMEVQLNDKFDYKIMVTNQSDMMVADVTVIETIPNNYKYISSSPSAEKDGNKLIWKMDTLAAKAAKEITISGSAATTDCLKHCATVTYIVPACANVQVVQPKLMLTKAAPAEVLLCEPIPVKFVVKNTGTGLARNVKIVDNLPSELMTTDGKKQLMFNAGNLDAGQSREFTAILKASATGKFVNKATATSGDMTAEDSTTTIVRQPILQITKEGPERRYLGRDVTYDITVTNKGDAPAANTVIEDSIPSGVTNIKASTGAKLLGSKVTWDIGTLAPNSSKKVSISYTPTAAGTVSNTAQTMATCAEGVTASAKTNIEGIPAVLLEVIDLDDPVEIGATTTYVITTTNQGSMADTNIKIECVLEDNMQYVSSSGATIGTALEGKITFAPLASLAPKAEASWRVVVKAVKPGDVRFTVIMNTDNLGRPVQETESTNLYE